MKCLALMLLSFTIALPAWGEEQDSPALSESHSDQPAATETRATEGRTNEAALQWNERQWRVNVADLLREQAVAEGTAKHPLTRELLALYNTLQKLELPARDQRVLSSKLENRLLRARREILAARPVAFEVEPHEGQLADHVILGQVGNFMGQQFGNQFAGGGNQIDDEGDELVELIEQTIDPDSWDINGGPGTIVYWGNLKVLVVRNTRDVHQQLQDLGEALRKAGN